MGKREKEKWLRKSFVVGEATEFFSEEIDCNEKGLFLYTACLCFGIEIRLLEGGGNSTSQFQIRWMFHSKSSHWISGSGSWCLVLEGVGFGSLECVCCVLEE